MARHTLAKCGAISLMSIMGGSYSQCGTSHAKIGLREDVQHGSAIREWALSELIGEKWAE